MVLLRQMLGDALRRLRLRQGRTLREVSAAARVSLGYLSEVERGQKEASSELLASICGALGAPLSQVLREVSDGFALAELQSEPAFGVPVEPAMAGQTRQEPALAGRGRPEAGEGKEPVPAGPAASHRVPGPVRVPQPTKQRLVLPGAPRKLTVRSAQHLVPATEPRLEQVSLPGGEEPEFETLTREITNMVPV
jgi:transcriptional regulator with XRE-family HTH domain